jgi:hypothetical protein
LTEAITGDDSDKILRTIMNQAKVQEEKEKQAAADLKQ